MRTLRYENLTSTQRADYEATLNGSHTMTVAVTVYDHNEDIEGTLDPDLYGVVAGQVDVDLTQTVPKQLSMDVQGQPGAFATDVRRGPFHPAKFLGVDHLVRVEDIDMGSPAWVACRVFYGAATLVQFDHNTGTTHVEAQSKESLYLPPNVANNTTDLGGHHADKRMTLRNLVHRLALDMGETKFRLARATVRIPFKRQRYDAFARANGAWPYLQRECRDHHRLLFFDRNGYMTMKQMSRRPVATFTTEALTDKHGAVVLQPNVATVPQIVFDTSTYINAVQVYGKLKAHGKIRLMGAAYEPGSAVFSSEGLERSGKRRLMLLTVTSDAKIKRAAAMKSAARMLSDAQLTAQQGQFTALPVPYLDLHDTVTLHGDADGIEGAGPHHYIPQQWTLPLVPGELMTVGFNSRIRVITKTKGKIRRHR